ncbi:MAG: D-glycero-beta-D-manno-heptose 1-phosphate adenylyltransferase [Ignavibacteriae bacterium]|nr:D-glycero-beta-D-manno-heptose 1-phosphate adenylyltransferase [Ignavibacteriota bacterium]
MGHVVSREELVEIRRTLKAQGQKVVFTNGVFDILHRGHVEYLEKARALGDVLMVGMNTDASVKKIKDNGRPIVQEQDRAHVLAALAAVDYVCLFPEETPYELLSALVPDVLVKGADWALEKVVGKDIVERAGGSVQTIEFLPQRSTTNIIDTIIKRFSK